MGFYGALLKSVGFCGVSMQMCGSERGAVGRCGSHGVNSMEFYGAQWDPMGLNGILWGSVELNGILWGSMGFYGTLLKSVGSYGV